MARGPLEGPKSPLHSARATISRARVLVVECHTGCKLSAQKRHLLGDHNSSPWATYQQVRWTRGDDTDRVPEGMDGFRTYCIGLA